MTVRRLALFVLAIALALAPPTARAFQAGSLLFIDPNFGVRLWTPGSQTSSLVISGPPLYDPRAVAVDPAGNVIVADPFAGVLRYSPTGAFQTNMGLPAIDVAIGSYGAVYELTGDGDVYSLSPPYITFVAGSIPDPRGIASSADQFGNDHIVVTSGANGGELLGVSQQSHQTTVLATNLGAYIEKPGVDRFGNVLVPRDGRVYVFDPSTGAQRGSFASSTILDPQDVTATSGDRYFVADTDNGGDCRIVEIDPIAGGATLAAPITIGANAPWSIAAVPGGTASPTLATGDIVLSDTGAFGGAGGIFRVSPAGNVARPLRLGGTPVPLEAMRVGPTRELVAFGGASSEVDRIDPGTGRATVIADASQIGGTVYGAAFDKNGDLVLSVSVLNAPGRILRVERALENVTYPGNVAVLATLNQSWWYPCCGDPRGLFYRYRAPAGSQFADAVLWTFFGGIIPVVFQIGLGPGAPILDPDDYPNNGTFDLVVNNGGAVSPDGTRLYLTDRSNFVVYYGGGATRTTLASGGFLTRALGLDVDEAGNVLVADAGINGVPGVIKVSPTGTQTVLTKMTFVAPDGIAVVPPPACSDGVDNDGDGLVDYPADPGCISPDDAWETVDCADGIDNDGDGSIDWDPNGDGPDPSCSTAQFGSEQTQCSDGADNDGDGKIDLADPQCTSPSQNREKTSSCGLLGIEVVGVAGWAVGRKARRARRSEVVA